MKFSKESHRKTGVGIVKGNEITGLLYKDPLQEKEEIEDVVNQRANSTKRLFNLFGTESTGKDISKESKTLGKTVNIAIGNLKYNKKNNQKEQITDKLTTRTVVLALENAANEEKNLSVTEDIINEACTRLLKTSFRTAKTKQAVKMLLTSVLIENKKLSGEEEAFVQEHFVEKLIDEYNKTSVRRMVTKSLKNQNMIVQPDKEGILVIAETKKSSDKKTSEKDAFRIFLSEYATLDDNKRHDMRVRLRRLVNLYFYGESAVSKDDFDEWKDHEDKKLNNELFIKKVVTIKNDKYGNAKEILDVDATKDAIRTKNIECYRAALTYASENTELFFVDAMLNKFWIHHIENEVERIYSHIRPNTGDYKYQLGYLSEKVWKGIINYLSIKYIAEGKAVYNYAMQALSQEGNNSFGQLDDKFVNGISSFEYERIKAEETLQRQCAVNVAFAANHLANATVVFDEKNTDFLLLKNGDISENERNKGVKSLQECVIENSDTLRNILQFFGGKSRWNDFDFSGVNEIELLDDMKKMIYSLRNSSFHFKTELIDNDSWNTKLIGEMFAHDCAMAGMVQKDKLYSNNVPMFYGASDIKKLLEKLYSRIHERASQVPSFNSVFVRKNFPEYLRNDLKITPALGVDDTLKWQSAVYYVYKEIYYNDFLQNTQNFNMLKDYVKNLPTDVDKSMDQKLKSERNAHKNFKEAFVGYCKECNSLSEVCQMIMTEYNNQNKGNRKVISARTNKGDELIFKHYKMILFEALKNVFTSYVQENADVYGFLKKPALTSSLPAAEEFLPDYKSNQYVPLIQTVGKNPELQKWYIVGRLLNPKQLNQMIGDFRSYVQYVDDVSRRAKQTGNPLSKEDIAWDMKSIIEILDVCTKLNGATSNCLEDYFKDADDYADYLAYFVDFAPKNTDFPAALLGDFCAKEIDGVRIGVFHDGTNPILNRNVIQCKLYGATGIIADLIKDGRMLSVDYEIIKKYMQMQNEIKEYQKAGVCKTKEEQQKLKKYQELKNVVELRNIVDYSEILDELQGQMINWGYLRERDLMYFQLGFHYLCLHNNSEKPAGYDNAGDISSAILYQLVAMYTNGLSLTDANGKSKKNAKASAGAKVGSFCSYSKEVRGIPKDTKEDDDPIYLAGLELFENIKEHNQCVDLRNYIEHFHYYTKRDRSMLDLYSEVFDRFFTYDMKYAKNVPNMMYNILLQHLVVAAFEFGSSEKRLGDKNEQTKLRAMFMLRENNGLSAEQFTYKLSGGNTTVKLSARGNDYLRNVASLLYYPDKAPEGLIRDAEAEDKSSRVNGADSKSDGRKDRGNSNKSNYSKKDKENWHNKDNSKSSGGATLADLINFSNQRRDRKPKRK